MFNYHFVDLDEIYLPRKNRALGDDSSENHIDVIISLVVESVIIRFKERGSLDIFKSIIENGPFESRIV